MATITVARSDLWPVGTSVGIYAAGAQNDNRAPNGAAIASASVDSAGLLTVTSGSLLSLTSYVAAASVGGVWRYARCRSTLDTFDRGTAVGTVTTNGTTALSSVSASSGAFAVGQRISGAGIPAGTRLVSGSGSSWVMSAAATASASGVAVSAEGARAGVAVLGSTVVPQTAGTTWAARVAQRRVTAGTS